MALILRDVDSQKELKFFIYLPEKIHHGHSTWLPPIYPDERNFFNSKKNPSFNYCETRLIVAYKDNKPVGRIMGIIHNKHNELFDLKNARFGYLECYNDYEIARALLSEIMKWGKEKGMNKIIGPYGFSDKDVQGFLISGFDEEPVIDSACNFPYMVDFMEKEGFLKEADCMIYRYSLDAKIPDNLNGIFERITARNNFKFLEFTSRKQLKPYIKAVFHVVNTAFLPIYGFVPMDNAEIRTMVDRYIPIIDPRFVKVITKNDEVIGFVVGTPTFTKGIQKAKGRLFPFGIFHILKAMRTATKLDLMLGALKPECQSLGLDIFLSLKIIEAAKKANYKYIDTHLVLEENKPMTAEVTRFGAKEIKRFRIFQKNL